MVKLGKNVSCWKDILYKGSVQGSIIGPLSFNIFLHDIFFSLENEVDVYNYADDNTFVCHGNTYDKAKHKINYVQISKKS